MTDAKHQTSPLEADLARQIRVVRGQRVLLDADLAALYGVTVKRLNEQIRRNQDRFPDDFLFRLTNQELADLRSQFATSSSAAPTWGGKRHPSTVFT